MSCAPATPTLDGPRVRLRPLQASDARALVAAAADGELWRSVYTVVPSDGTVVGYVQAALHGREAGSMLPFATEIAATGQVVGCTRLWKIDRVNRKLEIGGTWIAASWQRSFVNTEAKLLMLGYAFDQLQCVRVQLTTDELNERSQAAILRLGATYEGRIRNERLMPDGRRRNSLRYSIIDDEWPRVREHLLQRLRDAPIGASTTSASCTSR